MDSKLPLSFGIPDIDDEKLEAEKITETKHERYTAWLKDIQPGRVSLPPSPPRHGEGIRSHSPDYSKLPSKPLPNSYTVLPTHPSTGGWPCPRCRAGRTVPPGKLWILRARGYRSGRSFFKGWEDQGRLPPLIPETYVDFENELYFMNFAIDTRCRNEWDEGLGGFHCTFDRAKYDIERNTALEKEMEKPAVGVIFWDCFHCALPELNRKERERFPGLANYLDKRLEDGICIIMSARENKWEPSKKDWIVSRNVYDGTKESLTCGTRKFGKRDHPGSENTPCVGVYGAQWYRGVHVKPEKDGQGKGSQDNKPGDDPREERADPLWLERTYEPLDRSYPKDQILNEEADLAWWSPDSSSGYE